jgi:chromosome segregation ATPase
VALAAIQGLNQKLEDELRQKDLQISAQRWQIELLENEIQAMMARVEAVEANQNHTERPARLAMAAHEPAN